MRGLRLTAPHIGVTQNGPFTNVHWISLESKKKNNSSIKMLEEWTFKLSKFRDWTCVKNIRIMHKIWKFTSWEGALGRHLCINVWTQPQNIRTSLYVHRNPEHVLWTLLEWMNYRSESLQSKSSIRLKTRCKLRHFWRARKQIRQTDVQPCSHHAAKTFQRRF